MSKFNFIKTDIPDVQIIEPTVFGDDRGYFMETYQIDEFAAQLVQAHGHPGLPIMLHFLHGLANPSEWKQQRQDLQSSLS